MRYLVAAAAMVLGSGWLHAADGPEPGPQPGTEQEGAKVTPTGDPGPAAPEPFVPSEKIGAGSAVSFPVDI